jgi:GAF domain-containing protein
MTERFTLDRPSFEQVLCATSLIQQLNRRLRNSFPPDNDIQPLSDLVETQLAIETGTIDLETAMNRVVGLAMKLGRATGVATWLFTGQEFVYRAGTGAVANSNDERLQLEVLSKLVSICGASDHSTLDPRKSNDWSAAPDAIHYPGSVKSLLVAPIYQGRKVAGALAAFSAEFNAFTERDATRARLLSGLLAYALGKAAEAELKQNVSLERAAMLQEVRRFRYISGDSRLGQSGDGERTLAKFASAFWPGSCLSSKPHAGNRSRHLIGAWDQAGTRLRGCGAGRSTGTIWRPFYWEWPMKLDI